MENFINLQHNIVYSRSDQNIMSTEHYFPEHALGVLLSGDAQYFTNEGTFVMKAGTICLMRRNHLFRKMKTLEENGVPIALISLFLDQKSLHEYARENSIPKQDAYQGVPMINLSDKAFLRGFIDSLRPYIDQPGKLSARIAELKTSEAIELLLQTCGVLNKFLFDFQDAHKIDLEAYMNHNYKFNIPLSSFAKLTGRSLSTFKRDFTRTFGTTPEKWLPQKRLEQAHYLISKKHQRPSDVYLEVGFENLFHFSFAFKKLFGHAPTKLAAHQ